MTPVANKHQSTTRRHFLGQTRTAVGTAALASLLAKDCDAESEMTRGKQTHFVPTAKRVIYLFQSGGPSHLDLLDYKPELKRLHGSELPDSIRQGQRLT